MGRKLIGIPQRKFDFAITPKDDRDWEVVTRLEELKATNKLSEFLRSIIYNAVLTTENAIKPDESTMGQNEARQGIVDHDTPKPVDKPTATKQPVLTQRPFKPFSKEQQTGSNGKRHSKAKE